MSPDLIGNSMEESVARTLPIEDLLAHLLGPLQTAMRADSAGALLVTRDGRHLELCRWVGAFDDAHDHPAVTVGEGVEGQLALSSSVQVIEDLKREEVAYPGLRERFTTLIGAPLIVHDRDTSRLYLTGGVRIPEVPHGRVIGVVYAATRTPQTFTHEERERFAEAADRIALSLERARVAQAERRDNQRFRMLVDSVREYALFMLDQHGIVSSWNTGAEWLFGHPADRIIGEPVTHLHPPDDEESPSSEELLARAAQNGNVRSEGWRLRHDGSRFWAEVMITALHDESGELVGFGKVTRDLTDRRRIEAALLAAKEEAEAASAAKSQFLATMSHEIRTPINAVLGYTQLLELGLSGPVNEDQRQKLARVEASARHLLGLVNELLDLAKIEADQLTVERVRGSARDAADEALSLVFPQANARGITLTTRCVGRVDADYIGDPHRVEQILTNLLSNAVKFTGVGGRIDLTCGVVDEVDPALHLPEGVTRWCYMRVSDTGIGIAVDQLESIFDPFTQAASLRHGDPARRSTYTREHGGTGLGLTISRRLARLMRGEVSVESTVGVGTVFTLWVPAPVESGESSEDGGDARGMERRTGSRDARGLAVVGRTLRERARAILTLHVAGLREHLKSPNTDLLTDIDLEDHLDTLLTELALALSSVDGAAGRASRQLRDGNAIQRVLAQRHGAQRASLGWTEDDLRYDLRALRQEIEDELRLQLSAVPGIDLDAAIAVVMRRLAHVERGTLEGWRKRMNPGTAES